MKVYTKGGDDGMTSLIGGRRVPKCDWQIEACGAVDELNAHLGLLAAWLADAGVKAFVEQLQRDLFVVGSYLAADPPGSRHCEGEIIDEGDVRKLEDEIDRITLQIPPQNSFVLPGGCREAALAHVCRTVCRQAERRIVKLGEVVDISPVILRYMNRLSDYLFILARETNFKVCRIEKKW